MKKEDLLIQIKTKKSFLCIGLDTDIQKIPKFLLESEDPIFEFNKKIIDATNSYCVAYKPNIAFYESLGINGWKALEKTINYLNSSYPEIFTIADAKRGDIGNTSSMYAKAYFETLNFDSITINPYMGKDSVEPFLEYKNKHTILLALTSNVGAFDFQTKKIVDNSNKLYEEVIKTSTSWENSNQLMYVVGATKASYLKEIRNIVPNNFLLIPGVGAQGGDLKEVCDNGLNNEVGLLINSSRSIIYASNDTNFDIDAAKNAQEIQSQMGYILSSRGLV
ncbi:orotidine-5'-phosphate decarboxylase [Flavobacteriaceae bacterium]|jgi:orotidine-5'-phosphate decarboxylase|nr:orotidine-5'-phosphate decarboxylase [Flavobacteriaceae bacterium]MDB4134044.1 orotidine-5'-phosphate decarboxylase [Flavobacteriaceae bacterium]MDC0622471.1 orotidine-5'-phosphate decarboxylase [Flavobacteriaceae bacterium]MDC1320743.1 orotidine-5'-phosphate decarboxylase [Flavobacteriaceae bacterium]